MVVGNTTGEEGSDWANNIHLVDITTLWIVENIKGGGGHLWFHQSPVVYSDTSGYKSDLYLILQTNTHNKVIK